MIILGLTGSIGMGKSTTAQMFRACGVPVYDADQTVHDLYEGELLPVLEAAFPGVIIEGKIERQRLSAKVVGNSAAMKKLESIVHPAVRLKEHAFLKTHKEANTRLVILDIPLLFETGGDERVDKIIVVTAPASIQRERVLSRPDMTLEKFEKILSRQMQDGEKRERADFIIDTSLGMEAAHEAVVQIIETVKSA
ncbi:MAG: dephospho-CoA kinase [Hyphomicrobiales bacterium]